MKSKTAKLSAIAIAAASLLLAAAPARALEVPVASDAHVLQNNPTFNYGASPNLSVQSTSGSARRSYLRFDPVSYISPAMTAADIDQAWLVLYVNDVTTAGSLNVYRVTGTWTEGTKSGATQSGAITWNLMPSLAGSPLFSVFVSSGDHKNYIAIDVTSLVKDWVTNPSQNRGIAFINTGSINVAFDSKENDATSHAPALQITFKTKRISPGGDVTMGAFTSGPQP
jgi:hypothetical protein